jgi:hypothetical protein
LVVNTLFPFWENILSINSLPKPGSFIPEEQKTKGNIHKSISLNYYIRARISLSIH